MRILGMKFWCCGNRRMLLLWGALAEDMLSLLLEQTIRVDLLASEDSWMGNSECLISWKHMCHGVNSYHTIISYRVHELTKSPAKILLPSHVSLPNCNKLVLKGSSVRGRSLDSS